MLLSVHVYRSICIFLRRSIIAAPDLMLQLCSGKTQAIPITGYTDKNIPMKKMDCFTKKNKSCIIHINMLASSGYSQSASLHA